MSLLNLKALNAGRERTGTRNSPHEPVDSPCAKRHSNCADFRLGRQSGGSPVATASLAHTKLADIEFARKEEMTMRTWILGGLMVVASTGMSLAQDAAAGTAAFSK